MVPASEGLRERRRRATLHEIHAAALRLVREHGFGKVTIDMISAEAGISPRTFFNYFPSKEAAVVRGPEQLPREMVEHFVTAGAGDPGDILSDLTRLLVRHLSEHPPERRETHDMFELTRSHPAVLAASLAHFDAFQRSIADAVARRMGREPDDEVPTMIAALALAAVRTGLERWSCGDPADDGDTPVPYVERSVAVLHTLLAPKTA